ncbi:MAG: hypothetical protein [Microviridae sp.]|nr:MAG: hypothetical protein [Microviridae sp.]
MKKEELKQEKKHTGGLNSQSELKQRKTDKKLYPLTSKLINPHEYSEENQAKKAVKAMLTVKRNEQGEELIQRDEVENTPFIMITINNETFGTFGKYRITEMYHTKQQCKVELMRIDWNRLVQITSLIVEMLNQDKTK